MSRLDLRRESGAPLHHQIYLVLADGIANGKYKIGDVLPTEQQLTHMFGVSRITVRRAMETLGDAGLIERGAGRRTTVRASLGSPMRTEMTSILQNIIAYGTETDARVLEFGYVDAHGFARDHLWQAKDTQVQRVVRVRSHEGHPIMHLITYVPAKLGKTFNAEDLECRSLFELLARAGARLSRGSQVVSATLADPTIASRLDVKVGSALIDVRRLMFDQEGRAVEYVEMLAPPERLKLRMELGPNQLTKPSRSKKSSPKTRK